MGQAPRLRKREKAPKTWVQKRVAAVRDLKIMRLMRREEKKKIREQKANRTKKRKIAGQKREQSAGDA